MSDDDKFDRLVLCGFGLLFAAYAFVICGIIAVIWHFVAKWW